MGTGVAEISVVVPTRGRETRLAFALESLARQTLGRGKFEVVVVRDEDATPPLAPVPDGLRVRYLTQPRVSGPTTKRNLGWRAAEAPLVAFIDDDCRASPGWLAALVAARAGDTVFHQGRTEPDPDELHLMGGFARTQRIDVATGWFETCNMAYPRALLERLGGFDETFEFGGEDTDLAYRAIEAGAEPLFVDEALVWHAVMSRTFAAALREATRWPDMAAVIARHPQLYDSLYRRHFWNNVHGALAATLLGLAIGRGRPLPSLIALVPYLSVRVNWREPHPRRLTRTLLTLPVHAAIDATEIVARLPSAIRHRVPVI
ncbi:MAG: glycosyltransferase family 2 protein [Solirubrobacterales bacterium]